MCCWCLIMCTDLYEHFRCSLGDCSYYPAGSNQVSYNRLFGMYYANILPHNREVILQSMHEEDGVVCTVLEIVALGMGVHFTAVDTIYHYGAPRSIDVFFSKSGRAGQTGAQAKLCTGSILMHLSRASGLILGRQRLQLYLDT